MNNVWVPAYKIYILGTKSYTGRAKLWVGL